MKSIKLTVNYKNGTILERIVNYVHFDNGFIYFTVKKQISNCYENPVKIPISNIISFDVEESDRQYSRETLIVKKDGWKVLVNADLKAQGILEFTDEELEKTWNDVDFQAEKRQEADPTEYPISDDEVRISYTMFYLPWDEIKNIINNNCLEWRRDGYLLTDINI